LPGLWWCSIQGMMESSRKNPMVMRLFYILVGVWVTQVCAIFKTHQTGYL